MLGPFHPIIPGMRMADTWLSRQFNWEPQNVWRIPAVLIMSLLGLINPRGRNLLEQNHFTDLDKIICL